MEGRCDSEKAVEKKKRMPALDKRESMGGRANRQEKAII